MRITETKIEGNLVKCTLVDNEGCKHDDYINFAVGELIKNPYYHFFGTNYDNYVMSFQIKDWKNEEYLYYVNNNDVSSIGTDPYKKPKKPKTKSKLVLFGLTIC